MNKRQYKKLCKKSAEALDGYMNCFCEDGIWAVWWYTVGGGFQEWEEEDAWPYLVSIFDSTVNTEVDEDSDWGFSWSNDPIPATPRNVFKWAKESIRYNQTQ